MTNPLPSSLEGWQPIESAPKSGEVLVCFQMSGIRMLCRGDQGGCATEAFTKPKIAIGRRMMSKPQVFRLDLTDQDGKRMEAKPTHWMPLPKVPVPQS